MGDPAAADGHSVGPARLRSVLPSTTDAELTDAQARGAAEFAALGELTARLAEALRALRGYVPHRIWWDVGAAEVLIAYQATEEA